MSGACHSNATGAVKYDDEGAAVVRGIIRWLSLAAAPTFAMMSLLTAIADDGSALCSAAGPSALSGMAPMYLLMSAFHLRPWLKWMVARPNCSMEGREK